jgi:hypothetical protein
MASAAGNGPLAPRVGSIGYDGPIKRICILQATSRYKFQKHSDGAARFMSSSPHHQSILWLGASSPINQTQCTGIFDNICGARGPFPAAAAMVKVLVVFLRPLKGILNPLYVSYLKI